ncbi:MAG: hypothetical protein YHS30scaffold324_61 [Catenulispora phage 69_17]|jgi:hypothetical protein|nr:MAG: hypothetical protein YHS30scaffold324_61 [Catenulispora phage 69_17]
MSTYRYFATDVVTGAVRADTIPLHVDSFGRNLGGVGQPGQLTATLDLGALPKQSNLLAALEPRRTLLWALQDGWPIWAGVLWDWVHASAKSNQLPVIANELGSLFARRQVRNDQVYNGVDEFDVIRNLIKYATSTSVKGTQAAVAQLVHTANTSGIAISETFPAANLGKITDLVNQVCTKYGLEYAFDPGMSSTNSPIITLRIGTAATMGRPYSSTNLQLMYPGNAIDYAWPRTGSAGTSSLIAIASGSGGAAWVSNPATHGLDTTDLAAGYPLTEDSVSYTGSVINAQSGIDAFADSRQLLVAKSPTIGKVTLAGGSTPTVQQIQLGDHATLIATSSLHPAGANGAPGLIQDARIVGWTVHPPDGQPETTDLFLGGVAT